MLDIRYLSEVVLLAQKEESNAMAEIYAATCKKQYAFAHGMLGDDFLAQDALQEVYMRVFDGITLLTDGAMLIPWITRINFEVVAAQMDETGCSVNIEGKRYPLKRVLRLSDSEAMAIICLYYVQMSKKDTASLLEESSATLNHDVRNGLEKLNEQE